MRDEKSSSKQAIMGITFSIFAFFLSACDSEPVEEVVIAPQRPIENTSIILSEDGVGPIKADTAFNMHKIKLTAAFNHYSIVEELNYTKGHSVPIIRISEGVNTVMSLIPDVTRQGIYSVIVEDNIVKNSLGHPLGTLYSNIYAYGQNEKCQLGMEDMSGKVMCYAPKYPNILYVFNDNTTDIINVMPPADVLQGWALESIIWRPK